MENLVHEVKVLIVEALDLEDITPEEIDTDDYLFGEGLGLDSIDALELGLGIHKRFDIKIEEKEARKVFRSVRTLAEYLQRELDSHDERGYPRDAQDDTPRTLRGAARRGHP